jgi:hypothetical protein
MYGNFGRKITKCTVIHGVHMWFWPTLQNTCKQTHKMRAAKMHAPLTLPEHLYPREDDGQSDSESEESLEGGGEGADGGPACTLNSGC